MSAPTAPKPNPMQKYLDAFSRRVLRSPLHGIMSKRLMLVEVTGRKTGKTYVIPVAYAEHDGDVLMGVAKAGWLRNLSPDRMVTLTVRGRRVAARPELITEEGRAGELAAHIIRDNPVFGKLQQLRLDPDGSVNAEDLRTALDRGFTLVRLQPAT